MRAASHCRGRAGRSAGAVVAAGGGGLTEGAREERGGVLLEIKLKESIRTCLKRPLVGPFERVEGP